MTEKQIQPTEHHSIFFTLLVVGAVALLMGAITYQVGSVVWNKYEEEVNSDHIYGDIPDGWYHQREGITVSGQYSRVSNGTVWFAMCDHDYLGPLHGTINVAENVTFPQDGRYDLRVYNNTIVEAKLYQTFD